MGDFMSDEVYELGKGYWPDELDSEGNLPTEDYEDDYFPWEDWRLTLFGLEAGDCLETKKEIDIVLRSLGYKLIKIKRDK